MVEIPQTGDAVRLWQGLLNASWFGIVSDGDTPPMMSATMEMVDGEAVITTPVLVGAQGVPGENAPIVQLEWPAPADSGSLPSDWDESKTNHGYWIGGTVYVWSGTQWHAAQPGPAGPPGLTPVITPTCEVIPMGERGPGVTDEVVVTGTTLNPHYHFKLLAPQGPAGPPPAVSELTDYDVNTGAQAGKVLTVLPNGKWGPSDFAAKHPRMYSIPEQAFQNFTGLTQRHSILSYTIEAQDYDWVPYVTGHIKAFGVELDTDPLTIGCEVRLGDAVSGQLIGRGFGNSSLWATITPHFSTSNDTQTAVSPDNGVATVQAGQTAQINVNLYNDGLLGAYIFNRSGAQLSVLTVPQSGAGS